MSAAFLHVIHIPESTLFSSQSKGTHTAGMGHGVRAAEKTSTDSRTGRRYEPRVKGSTGWKVIQPRVQVAQLPLPRPLIILHYGHPSAHDK